MTGKRQKHRKPNDGQQLAGKRRKLNDEQTSETSSKLKDGPQFCAKQNRYKHNKFVQNEAPKCECPEKKKFSYFIRPFIPFWHMQEFEFQSINDWENIPSPQVKPLNFSHDLVKTWLWDKKNCCFDKKKIYDALKKDLIERIQSQQATTPKDDLSESLFKLCKDFFSNYSNSIAW